MQRPDLGKTELGMAPNVMAALCYAPLWIGVVMAIFFLVKEGENRFVRFNAIQSIGLGVIAAAAWFVFFIGFAVLGAVGAPLALVPFAVMAAIALIGAWLWALYYAYMGRNQPLPLIGEISTKLAEVQP